MLTRKKIHLLKYAGIAVLVLFSLFYTRMDVSLSGLEATRFAVIQAYGEQNVFHINNTQFRTVDRIIRDGKIYSDKPLPLAWSAGVLHKAVNTVTGLNFKDNYHLLVFFYNLIFGGLINILIFVWLFDHLRRYRKGSPEKKFLLALAAALGSWLLSYSVVLNNHIPAALAFLGWFIVLEKFHRKPEHLTACISGIAAGLVAATDLPTGFFACVLNIFALFFAGRKKLEYVWSGLASSALMTLFFVGLNYYAYETVLPLYIAHGGGSYSPGTGEKSHIGYLTEALIGYRGLFSYQPFLLFALPGIWYLRKRLSPAAWSVLAASVISIIFYLVMTNEFGGAAYGFRYLIPLIPVLWYFAAVWLLEKKGKIVSVLAVVSILWGVAAALAGAYAPCCLAFEGPRSPQGHVTRSIRSSFMGNLLSWSYETAPDSFLTRTLRSHYGEETAKRYLFSSYLMLKKVDAMSRIVQESQAEKSAAGKNR